LKCNQWILPCFGVVLGWVFGRMMRESPRARATGLALVGQQWSTGTTLQRPPRNDDESFRLRVRNPCGNAVVLQVSPGHTVAELKQQLMAMEGTDASLQRLLCNGVMMVDHRSLGSYCLKQDSVVVHVPQLTATARGEFPRSHTRLHKHERGPEVNRGFLMVPGCGAPWQPDIAPRVTKDEHDALFDSTRLPAPWKIRNSFA